MPGIPKKALNAEEFKLWKAQQDAQKQQVGLNFRVHCLTLDDAAQPYRVIQPGLSILRADAFMLGRQISRKQDNESQTWRTERPI